MREELAWTSKYRPTKLSEYVGNEYTKNKIKTLIARNRLPQTMLFQGERGTGKTTIARLVAKILMCESPFGGDACGTCGSCVQLDVEFIKNGKAPRNMSIEAYDITNMNTRADAANIVARMSRRAIGSEKRVYILDEMQRATSEAQSSFLKIAEEPVPGLYIILCTTDPEDLLVPFRSRFNKFDIRKPTNADIVSRVATICRNEGVDYTREGLRLLANKRENIPRECISQAELIGTLGKIDRRAVEQEMHIISQGVFTEFLDGCMRGNLAGVVTMLDKIQDEESLDMSEFVSGLGNYLADLLNAKAGVKLDSYSAEDIKSMRKYVKRFTDVQMVGMLKLLKEYSRITKSMDFQMLSLAVGFMEILTVAEVVREVTPSTAGTKFSDVTRQVRESRPVTGLNVATESDIQSIFSGAARVDIQEGEE